MNNDMQNVLMTVMHHASASSFTSRYATRNRRENYPFMFHPFVDIQNSNTVGGNDNCECL